MGKQLLLAIECAVGIEAQHDGALTAIAKEEDAQIFHRAVGEIHGKGFRPCQREAFAEEFNVNRRVKQRARDVKLAKQIFMAVLLVAQRGDHLLHRLRHHVVEGQRRR